MYVLFLSGFMYTHIKLGHGNNSICLSFNYLGKEYDTDKCLMTMTFTHRWCRFSIAVTGFMRKSIVIVGDFRNIICSYNIYVVSLNCLVLFKRC